MGERPSRTAAENQTDRFTNPPGSLFDPLDEPLLPIPDRQIGKHQVFRRDTDGK